MLVGNNRYQPGGSAITIWGDDETTVDKDGLYVGEKFDVKLFRHNSSILEDILVHSWKQGSGSYSINGISIAGSISSNIIQEKQLIKVTDIIGREINSNTKTSTLFYIYDDGSVERKYQLK